MRPDTLPHAPIGRISPRLTHHSACLKAQLRAVADMISIFPNLDRLELDSLCFKQCGGVCTRQFDIFLALDDANRGLDYPSLPALLAFLVHSSVTSIIIRDVSEPGRQLRYTRDRSEMPYFVGEKWTVD
jgi:hypothetical protein